MNSYFSSTLKNRLSLLDRGFAFAIAHSFIGGQEMGVIGMKMVNY